jgi:CRISPR system Cascade subunit CasD
LTGPISAPISQLVTSVPLARRPPRDSDWAAVDFVYEKPQADHPDAARLTLNDIPVDFHPRRRRYLARPAYVIQTQLPATLCTERGQYLAALAAYLQETPR